MLVRGEPNVSYICSRYYRAPELIFGATDYTCQIDVWSAGCVLAELLLGQPIFPGDSGVDQLVEIIKVLGTPTREQIHEMNPNYTEFKFPQIKAHPWNKVFRPRTHNYAISLVSQLLEYTPVSRISPFEACAHAFFDELRQPNTRLPNGRELPPLFNFTEEGKLVVWWLTSASDGWFVHQLLFLQSAMLGDVDCHGCCVVVAFVCGFYEIVWKCYFVWFG